MKTIKTLTLIILVLNCSSCSTIGEYIVDLPLLTGPDTTLKSANRIETIKLMKETFLKNGWKTTQEGKNVVYYAKDLTDTKQERIECHIYPGIFETDIICKRQYVNIERDKSFEEYWEIMPKQRDDVHASYDGENIVFKEIVFRDGNDGALENILSEIKEKWEIQER